MMGVLCYGVAVMRCWTILSKGFRSQGLKSSSQRGRCSFCAQDRELVRSMRVGTGDPRICNSCLKTAQGIIAAVEKPRARSPKGQCAFCGETDSETNRLVAGPDLHICSRCVCELSKGTD
jgi:hypothetical protein